MYKVLSSSQQPLDGDNWQDSFLKDFQWVVLQKVKSEPEEPQPEEPSDNASEVFLVLNSHESDLFSDGNLIQTQNESESKTQPVNEVFQCEECNKIFKRKRYLNHHKCVTSDSKSAQCEICHKTFFDYSTLIRHVRLHSGIKPFKCDICCRSFSRNDNLQTHRKLHDSKSSILCNIVRNKRVINVPLEFKRRSSLSDCPNPFICVVCDKKFARKTSLTVHMRLHLPFQCVICNSSFSMKRQVMAHLRTHGNLEPSKRTLAWKLVMQNSDITTLPSGSKEYHAYQCKICLKPFPLRSNLIEHERVHTGQKPYECDICYKRVSSRGILNIHRRIHTGERPYQCPSCPRAFIEKTKLNIHMRFHTGVKPYECSVCHKAFSRRQYLRNHFRIHTGERPFECNICHKSFIEKSAHNRHKKTHFSYILPD